MLFLCRLDFPIRLFLTYLAVFGIFLSLPSVEAALCLFLVERTFCHASFEVLHKHNTFHTQDVAYGVCGLCTYTYPVHSAVEIEVDHRGVEVWVVRTDTLNEFAVTRRAAVCHYDVVVGVIFVTMTSQTNFSCHIINGSFMGCLFTKGLPEVNNCAFSVVHRPKKAREDTASRSRDKTFEMFFVQKVCN